MRIEHHPQFQFSWRTVLLLKETGVPSTLLTQGCYQVPLATAGNQAHNH